MNDRPPLIETQGMRLLLETEQPERFLRAEYFRSGRAAGPAMAADNPGTWAAVDRWEVARNQLTLDDDSPCDLSRLVITTDAGVGKTITMQWFQATLSQPGSTAAAFYLTFHQLPDRAADMTAHTLLPGFRPGDDGDGPPPTEADRLRVLEQLRSEGRLVLLIDALDQAPPDGAAVRTLRQLLDDPSWRSCRWVVSGRPYALQRYWAELFQAELGFGWRFVQVDEFDEPQQRTYLGDARFEAVPAEAREILATPRVLKYLRDLPEPELGRIKSAGDVYWHSIHHLLKEGMKGSDAARKMGLAAEESVPGQIQQRSLLRARKLLGAIAFEMTNTLVRGGAAAAAAEAATPHKVPNFDGVPPNQLEAFKDRLVDRLSRRPGDETRLRLDRDIDSLSALNEFLEHGIFDTDVTGLDRIYWRNRTLQEFFAAFWLAQYGTPADAGQLGDWLYLPEQPRTEQYYWVWRFLCEMHQDGRNPEAWTRAVEPIYRPGDGTVEGTRRSSEMIYRAWQPLQQQVEEGVDAARDVQAKFLSEFENQILSGKRGREAKESAEQFCANFIEVPAGEFQMGAPEEKQGMSEDIERRWRSILDEEGDPEDRAEKLMARLSYAPTKQGQDLRDHVKQRLMRILATGDLDEVRRWQYPTNETPAQPVQTVDGLLLCRWPTINRWYRLFRPGHGQMDTYYRKVYQDISPQPATPVIFVTWYDAWAFCVWAHWQSRSCQLPREYEWEYAAKAGTPWDWNYWWGEDFDAEKCNADNKVRHTTPPTAAHGNPWGFEDVSGNVLEWCEDRYRQRYDRDTPSKSSARVLRGGSWDYLAHYARSAYRYYWRPSYSVYCGGFRVARAK